MDYTLAQIMTLNWMATLTASELPEPDRTEYYNACSDFLDRIEPVRVRDCDRQERIREGMALNEMAENLRRDKNDRPSDT